jgi:Tfp pilus assembly protein PilN
VPISPDVRAVNLLPPNLRGASTTTAEMSAASEAGGGAGTFVVLGVLAACVAGAAGYALAGNTVKQRQADLAAATAQQQAIVAKVAALKPYADFDAKSKSRVQTVRDLAGSRFDWQQALGDIARAIPADVTLKTLNGDTSTGTGVSDSPLRGAIASPAITLTGCAPGQSDVARLMARLHDVDGVTRVSLSKSDTTAVTAASSDTSGESSLAQRNAAPCGPGNHPSFEVVAFFERAAAAVSAPPAGSSTVTTATATPTPSPTATPTGSSATTTSSEGTNP